MADFEVIQVVEVFCLLYLFLSHGLYRGKVREMHEDYIMPQENGSHFDCDYVEIVNGQYGMAVASEKTFSITLHGTVSI